LGWVKKEMSGGDEANSEQQGVNAMQSYEWFSHSARTVEDVVRDYGWFAHGGEENVGRVVAEWEQHGFTALEVAEWLDAEVVWPEDAAELRDDGVTPEEYHTEAEWIETF
jgi:hypothetical protein